jgi:hypothetical protein
VTKGDGLDPTLDRFAQDEELGACGRDLQPQAVLRVPKIASTAGNAMVGEYYAEIGLRPNSIVWLTSAPPTGMLWLTSALRPNATSI